jgi:nucleotide-binding universal stress UspA family protein
MFPFKHVLVATDFHESSKDAVDLAAKMTLAADGSLTVEHTFEVPSYAYLGVEYSTADILSPLEDAAQKSLDGVVRTLRAQGVNAHGVLRKGVAWERILEEAKTSRADVIVMGTHGRKGVARALLGSVAEKVVRLAPVPVLTVHGEAKS